MAATATENEVRKWDSQTNPNLTTAVPGDEDETGQKDVGGAYQSYSDDIPHAEKVLAQILEDHPMVLKDPEPIVKLHNLGDSSVDFIVRPWCMTDDYWDVYWDVTREVKMRFDKENISIPFPQRDIHHYDEKRIAAAS